MATVLAPPSDAITTEIQETEEDLRSRLAMLGADDDAVVLLGLAAAGLARETTVASFCERPPLPAPVGPADLADLGVGVADFNRFHELWYRFKVPHAHASLAWWQHFCVGLGRHGGIARAVDAMTHCLAILDEVPLAEVPQALASGMGYAGDTAVLTASELDDVPALARAVRLRAPLVPVEEPAPAAAALRAAGHRVEVLGRDGRGDGSSAPTRHCLRSRPRLGELEESTRRAWERLSAEERTAVLTELCHRAAALEQVRFVVGDDGLVDNRGVVQTLQDLLAQAPQDWPAPHRWLATLWWCWREAAFVIQELNQSILSLPALSLFFQRRLAAYARRLPAGSAPSTPEADDLVALARTLGARREQIERSHLRCLHFDGSNWERREFLIPRAAYARHLAVPDGLRDHLRAALGVEFPPAVEAMEGWDRYLDLALAAGHSPTRVMQTLARWAVNNPELPVDLAIFTVPMGIKLDQPWTLEFHEVFCYTAFRDAFVSGEHGVPFDRVGIQNAVGQRMRYNVVKKAQNYALVKRYPPQSFNLPDIAIAEDANHGGHNAAGIRLACRIPSSIDYAGRVWKGLADLRLNRADYRFENHFRPRDLPIGHRYMWWARGIAEATYRRGLTFDRRWCEKVDSVDD